MYARSCFACISVLNLMIKGPQVLLIFMRKLHRSVFLTPVKFTLKALFIIFVYFKKISIFGLPCTTSVHYSISKKQCWFSLIMSAVVFSSSSMIWRSAMWVKPTIAYRYMVKPCYECVALICSFANEYV